MSDLVNEILKIPPVTRFLCVSVLAVSLPAKLNFISPYSLVFIKELVTYRLELWRLYTSFFLGGGGLNFIFDFVMLYRNSNELESSYSGRSADYAWQMIIAGAALVGFNIPLRTFVHLRPLLVTLTYLSSRLAPPGAQTSLMGLITFPIIYFPYALVGMDLVMAGPSAAACSITGILVGHLWWLSVWKTGVLESIGQAPRWLKALIGRNAPSIPPSSGVHVIPPRAHQPATQRGIGYNWGSGQRLGGS